MDARYKADSPENQNSGLNWHYHGDDLCVYTWATDMASYVSGVNLQGQLLYTVGKNNLQIHTCGFD